MPDEYIPRCPFCRDVLATPDLYCKRCDKTLIQCPNCKHLFPDWLAKCTYCNASLLPDRALEFDGEEVGQEPAPPRVGRTQARGWRLDRLETGVIPRDEYPDIGPETPEAGQSAPTSIPGERVKFVTHLYAPEELEQSHEALQLEEATEQATRDKRIEALNPQNLLRRTKLPTTILIIAIVCIYLCVRATAYTGWHNRFLLIASLVAIASFLWIIVVAILDYRRCNRRE